LWGSFRGSENITRLGKIGCLGESLVLNSSKSTNASMNKSFELIFDDIILKQLKKAGKNQKVREILKKMFDKLELAGSSVGELLDSQLFIYEIKNMHPPIRLYFKHDRNTNEIKVFEFEMKTSKEKQQKTIQRIKFKVKNLES